MAKERSNVKGTLLTPNLNCLQLEVWFAKHDGECLASSSIFWKCRWSRPWATREWYVSSTGWHEAEIFILPRAMWWINITAGVEGVVGEVYFIQMSGFLAFKIYENAKKPPWNCLLYRPGSQGIVGSTEQARGGLWERVRSASGEWRKGNHFVWKAKWALRERASGEQNREGLSSYLRTPIWMKYQS